MMVTRCKVMTLSLLSCYATFSFRRVLIRLQHTF